METIENEIRPLVAVGHVSLTVSDIAKATEYFVGLGLRKITQRDSFAVLELRGGTHLQLLAAEEPIPSGQKAAFDLMGASPAERRKETLPERFGRAVFVLSCLSEP